MLDTVEVGPLRCSWERAGHSTLPRGALALVNDAFLQLVKTETHRGLEGRALGGFWTGGRVYGYPTETEPNPPDHAANVVQVDRGHVERVAVRADHLVAGADPRVGHAQERAQSLAAAWSSRTATSFDSRRKT